jgi:hypothetical protein
MGNEYGIYGCTRALLPPAPALWQSRAFDESVEMMAHHV